MPNDEIELIDAFDSLRFQIINYINFRKQGLISGSLSGLKIKELEEDLIYIQNLINENPVCAITFSSHYDKEYLRVFSIQMLNNRGNLGVSEIVSLYKNGSEKNNGFKEVNEKQREVILATKTKVDAIVAPLNKEAREKFSDQVGKLKGKI